MSMHTHTLRPSMREVEERKAAFRRDLYMGRERLKQSCTEFASFLPPGNGLRKVLHVHSAPGRAFTISL